MPEAYRHLAPTVQSDSPVMAAEQCQRRAYELVLAKQYDAAEREYLAALKLLPGQTEIATNLGLVYTYQKRFEEAARTFEEVLAVQPDHPAAQYNLSSIYIHQERFDEAEMLLQALLQNQPQMVGAQKNLGIVLYQLERPEEAVAVCRSALLLNPQDPEIYFTLSDAFIMLRRYSEAEESVEKAATLGTQRTRCFLTLGKLFAIQGRFEESDAAFEAALALEPDSAKGYFLKSACHAVRGDRVQASVDIRKAIQLNPKDRDQHVSLGISLLLTGQREEGWKEYEFRSDPAADRKSAVSRWQGESLQGKKILVMSEQGMGDMIQFVRFLPLLKKAGASEVILECYPELTALFRKAPGMDRMVVRNPRTMPSEPYDLQVRMMSLAYLFAEEVPYYAESVPYLRPDFARLPYWKERLGSLPGLKVGIFWAGRALFGADWNRSCSLEQFLPLVGTPGVTLVSLQKGRSAQQIRTLGVEKEILDLDDGLKDFADTAAAISQLDLVISVDTGVAHLAGALGRPTWTLLPFCSEWRWLLERTDSPWYPTMRLFRQPRFREWDSVFTEVKTALVEITKASTDRPGSVALPPSRDGRSSATNLRPAPTVQDIDRERAAQQHYQRGGEFVLAKQFDAAEREYLAALEFIPGQPGITTNLGLVYLFQERFEESERTLKGVLAIQPDAHFAQSNLATLYLRQRRFEEAETVLQALLQQQPHLVAAQKNLGFVLVKLERSEEAIPLYQTALLQKPQDPDIYYKLAEAYMMLRRYPEAEATLRKASMLETQQTESYVLLANLLTIQGKFEESDAVFQAALVFEPDAAAVYHAKGVALYSRGDAQQAIINIRKAIKLNPNELQPHVSLGVLLLLTGEWEEGWKEFEYRTDPTSVRNCAHTRQGESLQGKRVLVMSDAGMGDMIQFVRFLPLLKKAGATEVILECFPKLTKLFQKVDGMDRMVVHNPFEMPSTPYDLQVRMMSLAYLCASSPTYYAESVPYLQPDPMLLPYWQERLGSLPGLKVGIVWAGSHEFGGDWNRSCSLEQFLPLVGTPGVTLVSLQKGRSAQQIRTLGVEKEILDLDAALKDFADTAAAISQLDLVISVDTGVAHLAGALGRPTWTLLPFCSEWRWLLERTDSPWYPTMRLFRQPRFREWDSVFTEVKTALAEFAKMTTHP